MRIAVLGSVVALMLAACGTVAGMSAYNQGVQHQQKGERTLAEQQFKIALQQDPDLAEAHLNLGLLYIEDGWLEGAEEHTQAAITIFERTKRTYVEGATYAESLSLAYNNLGVIQLQRWSQKVLTGSPSEVKRLCADAAADFRKAIDLNRANSKAQANMSRLNGAC
jgi:tetratricopeptide (TPR) repeat protein